jgi:hypothetical protein
MLLLDVLGESLHGSLRKGGHAMMHEDTVMFSHQF